MSIIVLVAKSAMICAMFRATLETFVVSSLMLVGQLPMVLLVRIALGAMRMRDAVLMQQAVNATTIVLVIMGKCGNDRGTHHKHRCCKKNFPKGHVQLHLKCQLKRLKEATSSFTDG